MMGRHEDIAHLSASFAIYSEALVTRRLLASLGVSEDVIRAVDLEIDELRENYENLREAFMSRASGEVGKALAQEAGQRLDELLLYARREALSAKAQEFLPEGSLLWMPEPNPQIRCGRFLAWLEDHAKGGERSHEAPNTKGGGSASGGPGPAQEPDPGC